MRRMIVVAIAGSMMSLACAKQEPTGTAGSAAPAGKPAAESPAAGDKAGAPAAETPCDAVVEKLASYDKSAGDPEKKLWTKMCADMPQEARACIVASKTPDERDKCMKDEKLIK